MEPEYKAYKRSPHAKVPCVDCHIGEGADWFARSKLSGMRQVWATFTGEFSRPVPTPIKHLRPARETCEKCHWTEKFHGARLLVRHIYGDDVKNTRTTNVVRLKVGGRNKSTGRYEGIHWHVAPDVRIEYEALDSKRTKGVTPISKKTADKKYSGAQAYHKARHRLYGESLAGYQTDMKAAGVGKVYYQDYTAFPTWRPPTMWKSADKGYKLHLLSHKQVEFKQSRASFVPVLAELAPEQLLLINPTTAKAAGVAEGDAVTITSHHALTGETRSLKTKAHLFDGLRPDTVSLSHHYGLTSHPSTKGQGSSPNNLFFGDEGYIQCTNDASFHVMVKVTKG